VTNRVTLVAPEPVGTVDGLKDPDGGFTESWKVAVPPGLTVADVEPPLGGAKLKSLMVTVTAVLVIGLKPSSPEYTAVMLCVPTASDDVVKVAVLPLTFPVPSEVVPSTNVTDPVGDPEAAVSVAVRVTGLAAYAEAADELRAMAGVWRVIV